MKNILFFLFVFLSLSLHAQLNLIQDKNFEAADLSRVYVESDTNPASAYGWAKVIQASWNDDNVKITVVNDAQRSKTAQMELVGTNSIPNTAPFRAFIAQRVGIVADPALYRISFWAKAINGTPVVRIFVKLDAYTNQYIIFDTDKPTNQTSTYTAYCKNLTPSAEWTYFENVVDLSKKTTSRGAINNTQAIATTESERTNVAVCFQNNTAGSTVQVDQVEFTKVSATTIDLTSGSTNLSSYTNCPTCTITVSGVGTELIADETKTIGTINVEAGSRLSLNSGKTLTVSSLSLKSNASGTATLVDNSISDPQVLTATVEQYLSSARNWYATPAVSGVKVPTGKTYYSYDETGLISPSTQNWVAVEQGSPLDPMKGYIIPTDGAVTMSNTGTLTTGPKQINLTRTGATKSGFNLVANPYPSYLDWSMVDTTAAKITPTVWYRTKTAPNQLGQTFYTFDTYNGKLDEATSLGEQLVTKLISPMQAFWVRIKENETAGTLTFTNAMRKHVDNTSNKFKAPVQNSNTQLLRLQISNGTNRDEALICFHPDALNKFDAYDSQKWFNSSDAIPELYTKSDNEQLVINGLNQVVNDLELPIGYCSGQAAPLSIKALEMNKFEEGTKIFLIDKVENTQTELESGTSYNFTSDKVMNNENRFSLLFKVPQITTSLDAANSSEFVSYLNNAGQIVILSKPNAEYCIFNASGVKIQSGITKAESTICENKLSAGVYMVKLSKDGNYYVKKLIVN